MLPSANSKGLLAHPLVKILEKQYVSSEKLKIFHLAPKLREEEFFKVT